MPEENASPQFDVLIVGAGTSGATAAALCARKDLSVGLLDIRPSPRVSDQSVWINAEARDLLEQCGADIDSVGRQPVGGLTFCSADFEKTISSEFETPLAYVVNRAELENELIEAAVAAGASLQAGKRVETLDVMEETVRLTLEGESHIEGRFLIAADGARSSMARQLGLVGSAAPSCWCAQADVTVSPGSKNKPAAGGPSVTMVLGMIESRGVGTIIHQADRVAIRLAGPGTATEIGEFFDEFVSDARQAGLLGKDVDAEGRCEKGFWHEPMIEPIPVGMAIELESHVGKRSLLVGDAGGFAASISYEGIYPGMWSAAVATEVIADAAAGETGQDILGEFDGRWRLAMADYLRMPNTDLHFLLPLVFSNQQMADRMAAAILSGKNI